MSDKTKYSKMSTLRNAPEEYKALLNKLVKDTKTGGSSKPSRPKIDITTTILDRISRDTSQNIVDADTIFQLLPDVELASQILIGSIISPKDMSTIDVGFTVGDNQYDGEVTRSLLQVIEEFFKNDYKIDDRLNLILKDILFLKGASITAIIPENTLDFMINGKQHISVEAFDKVLNRIIESKPMGFLGHPREPRVSLETYHDKHNTLPKIKAVGDNYLPGITVGDNLDCFKIPRIRDKRRTKVINRLLKSRHVSLENAAHGLTDSNIDELYKQLGRKSQPTQIIPSPELLGTDSIGHPLTIELPVESVIPVHVPGDPSNHVGYFVLLDQNGRPVLRDNKLDYYGELRTSFTANTKDNSSEIVRQVREAMGGVNNKNQMDFEQLQEAYNKIIENDLISRLRNGIYSEELSVGFTDEIYRIMLYRTLSSKNTQLIYIPAELVVYMAFDYNEHGIGKTLLEKSKILSSMRSVLLFAETMSGVRNAIGRKRTSITIDPQDPDPQKTIYDIQTAILESAHRGFPLGSPDPAQTLDYLNRAAYDFNINIENDEYPTTKVEYDDYNTEVRAGNTELQERLQKMHISGMGLSPEWVDPQSTPEFAVSVITNNLLMQRRIMQYQKEVIGFLTRFVRIYTQQSGKLRQELLALLPNKENVNELDDFISSINVTLPSPDNTKIELHIAAFEQYTQLLERALEAYITPDLFPTELLAQDSELVTQTFNTIKAYFQRMWLERNNILPELDQLINTDEDDKFSLLDIQSEMFENIGKTLLEYITGIKKIKEKWNEKYQMEEISGNELETSNSDQFDSPDNFSDELENSLDSDELDMGEDINVEDEDELEEPETLLENTQQNEEDELTEEDKEKEQDPNENK